MGIITIQGGTPLRGETVIQGAKNSALPILAASLLSGDVCRIEGCPHLSDVDSAADILRYLGCTCLLYTSPSPRDLSTSRMPSSA